MAKVKFFISAKKSNPAKILLRFTGGRQFDFISQSQQQINPEYWNNKTGIVRQRAEFVESDDLKEALFELEEHIIKSYNNTPDKTDISKDWLNKTIDKYYNPDKYLQVDTLFGFIQQFINNSHLRLNEDTGNPVCYNTRREYIITFNYLKEYAKKYKEPDFIDIDLEFYNQFVDFLRNKDLQINTIGKKIKTLKIFLNDATEKSINKYQKYKSRKFKTLSDDVDNIYLSKPELNQFYEFDFSDKPSLERVRDLFIVGCWTGVRFSDFHKITSDNIKGDIIELRQQKGSGKVAIPLYSTVKEILKKYDGILPKPISNQKFNDYLKIAAKLAGLKETFTKTTSTNGMKHDKTYFKHELISSHTGRRSFCTNAYEDNIPTLSIMAISGHKTEAAFLLYIKMDAKKHAEKVLKIWKENGEFMKVAK
jgi:site-specific recombinase XerD